jgi:hypothetical protein
MIEQDKQKDAKNRGQKHSQQRQRFRTILRANELAALFYSPA